MRCTRHYVSSTPPPLPSPEASPSNWRAIQVVIPLPETTDSATGDGTTTDARCWRNTVGYRWHRCCATRMLLLRLQAVMQAAPDTADGVGSSHLAQIHITDGIIIGPPDRLSRYNATKNNTMPCFFMDLYPFLLFRRNASVPYSQLRESE